MQEEDSWYNDTTGSFDIQQYLKVMMDDHDHHEVDVFNSMIYDDEEDHSEDEDEDDAPQEKKTRKKRIILARRKENGLLEAIPPKQSLWWHMYVDCPQPDDSRFLRKFRRRFRHPYAQFVWFVAEARKEKWFPEWMGKDAKGKPSSPLELLILGAFRYLGRGLTFDDLEESTAISEEVHRKFFHKFIKIGSTVLYDRYVRAPQTKEEVQQHMHEFATAGLPGAFASTDATNIIHELCNWKNRRAHIGFKSKHACRTYNTTVNHRRRILASTFGNPGSFNDKTLILFDTFIRDIKRGEKLDDYTFELLERRGEEVVAVQYKGVWIVVDNGYHNWSTTVPPMSNCVKPEEIRWSAWVESMRKDVECTFGILKGRWRILKTGVRLHSTQSVDRVWLTCCALHNWLLEIDGLDQTWDGVSATASEWEGEFGELEEVDAPMAIRNLLSTAQIREYDTSTIGGMMDVDYEEEDDDDDDEDMADVLDESGDGVINVRNLSLDYFRSKLVEHFDIKFQRGEINWPQSRGPEPRGIHEI